MPQSTAKTTRPRHSTLRKSNLILFHTNYWANIYILFPIHNLILPSFQVLLRFRFKIKYFNVKNNFTIKKCLLGRGESVHNYQNIILTRPQIRFVKLSSACVTPKGGKNYISIGALAFWMKGQSKYKYVPVEQKQHEKYENDQ